MAYRGGETKAISFTGGLASSRFSTTLAPNQALDLRNVLVNSTAGLEKRRGDTEFNSSAMIGSSTAIAGLGSFNALSGTQYLLAVASTSLFQSSVSSGTMTDITGAITIGSGQDKIWDIFVFNDNAIGVGGAPNAPWTWTGSGNAAALGGTPPSGNFGFQYNNRVFIGNTSSNPSRIAWSILGSASDWSGSGSGTSDVWTNDGDNLVGAAILSDDIVILFKQRSIHKMIGRTSPFPIFALFKDNGAVGKHAIVVVDGICYFITPKGRMKATDGSQIISFSDDIDDVWNGLNQSRLQYIQGIRYTGIGFDHLIWCCSNGSSTTNNLAIIWDLTNKCWLKYTTGYNSNVLAKIQDGTLYAGHYNGKIYKKDVASTYTDASETSPGAIDSLWRTGWFTNDSFEISFHPFRLNVGLVSQSGGNLSIGYGFDFSQDQYIETVGMLASGGLWDQFLWDQGNWGGQTDLVRSIFLKGRGNAVQFMFSNRDASLTFKIHSYTISGKKSQQKTFEAT